MSRSSQSLREKERKVLEEAREEILKTFREIRKELTKPKPPKPK